MTLAFHLTAVLLLMALQTALRLHVRGLDNCFDLLIVYVSFLGLYRHPKEALPVILLSGICMDSLSGGSFGLFLTSYLWFYVLLNRIVRFLHPGNRLLLLFSVGIGVVIENTVHLGIAYLIREGFPAFELVRDRTLIQLLWALSLGPVLLVLVHRFHHIWERWLSAVMVRDT
jgi:rod shape-determining protein MreD